MPYEADCGQTGCEFATPTGTEQEAIDAIIHHTDKVVKRPVIPTVMFGEGGLDREMVDMIAVDGEGELRVLEDGGDERTPIGDLISGDQDDRDGDQDQDDHGRGDDNADGEGALAGI